MSRKKIEIKNKPVSISLPQSQIDFILLHPHFNLSKYVQMQLNEYINLSSEVEELEKEEGYKIEEVVIL